MTRQMPASNLKEHAIEALAVLANARSATVRPQVHFVAIGKPVRGGTHHKIKAFMISSGCSLVNVTGYMCSALGLKLDTYDLSTVVHRDTIILANLALVPGLERFKDAELHWQ